MISPKGTERIDTLLALAISKGEGEAALDLDRREQQAMRSRAEWYAQLTPDKQASWIARTLRSTRAREKRAQLDEHIHATHVVESLRHEPERIRLLILKNLPRALATQVAAALNISLPDEARAEPSTPERASADNSSENNSGANGIEAATPSRAGANATQVFEIVRRIFLSRFVSVDELTAPTALDLLSGTELARLVRLLGAREIAIVCRTLPTPESIPAFLRRFSAEDAHAITAHLPTLTNVEPERMIFAEQLVSASLNLERLPGSMLNSVGVQLLALALSGGEPPCVRYTLQKIPVEAANGLAEMVAGGRNRYDARMTSVIAREVGNLAAGLRQSHLRNRQPATPRADEVKRF